MGKYTGKAKKGRLGRGLNGGRSQGTDVFFPLGQKLSNLTDTDLFAV